MVIQISEVMFEDEWPYSNCVYVVTTATAREVNEWVAELQPDPYDDEALQGWLGGTAPPGAPAVPEGHHVVTLFWAEKCPAARSGVETVVSEVSASPARIGRSRGT